MSNIVLDATLKTNEKRKNVTGINSACPDDVFNSSNMYNIKILSTDQEKTFCTQKSIYLATSHNTHL